VVKCVSGAGGMSAALLCKSASIYCTLLVPWLRNASEPVASEQFSLLWPGTEAYVQLSQGQLCVRGPVLVLALNSVDFIQEARKSLLNF